MIGRLILGDNAFFGIGHRSRAEAREKAHLFADPEKVTEIFRMAKACGAEGVMLSAHEGVPRIVRALLADPKLGGDFTVYPNIPYLMKYVSAVTKHGILGALTGIVFSQSAATSLRQASLGAWGLWRKDLTAWIKIAIDLEAAKYRGCRVGAIFLHNGFVDLALGLGAKEPFLFYNEYIRKRYKTIPGFGTLNLPRLVKFLKACGLTQPLIMAPVNASGFHMNPSQRACEETLGEGGFTLLAMNVLASGSLPPAQAMEYLGRLGTVRHVVLGASSRTHIEESFGLAKKFLGD